jgi:outer membrane immunogenic protein
MKKLIVGVAAALSFTTSNAIADGPYKRPPPTIAAPKYEAPPPPSWTGFYFGAGIGAGAVLHDFDRNRSWDGGHTWDRSHLEVGDDFVFGTVTMGYDWQHTNFLFGVFGDFDFGNNNNASFDHRFLRRELDIDNIWSVGGRVGILTTPATLWYVSGGWAQADIDSSARRHNGDRVFSFDDTLNGFFVGAGIDTRLHNNWFLRLEYRFTQFDDNNFRVHEFDNHDVETTLHTARLTLTYKFTHGLGWGSWGSWGKW